MVLKSAEDELGKGGVLAGRLSAKINYRQVIMAQGTRTVSQQSSTKKTDT